VEFSLPRALSHEVDHSVRILAGPEFGNTLLTQIISEGISSVFDEAAFPGPPDPWDRAISPSQECALWNTAQLDLGDAGMYDLWMFGSPGVIPHWTGFTIGYDIVKDYRDRHPQVSWSALTSTSAATILAGSGYRPCARLQGHVEVGARRCGFEPDEQAGEGRLGHGQVHGAGAAARAARAAARAQLALRHDAVRAEDGHLFRSGRPACHHGQVAAREGLLGAHREAEDAIPVELIELVGGQAQAP
jgi:Predicted Zn-dependent protease (DUF2268)